PPLTTWSGASSSANMHNLEGIKHYQMGHWDVAKGHFEEAIQEEPNVAEPHYNLALALHQLGAHEEATVHFKKAAELAPDDRAITQSRVYLHHVAPRRSSGGGYY
ncbi:MAG: tetratricopeptide repeat protein, partial [Nitrospiraceae bacterium]